MNRLLATSTYNLGTAAHLHTPAHRLAFHHPVTALLSSHLNPHLYPHLNPAPERSLAMMMTSTLDGARKSTSARVAAHTGAKNFAMPAGFGKVSVWGVYCYDGLLLPITSC